MDSATSFPGEGMPAAVFRDVANHAPHGIALQRGIQIVYANPALLAMLRGEPHQVLGKRMLDFIAPEYQEFVRARIARLDAGQSNEFAPERLIALDGSSVEVEISAFPLDIEGSPGFAILVRDVSERVDAERLARASEERARLVLRATADVVWDHDLETDEINWSAAFSTLFGYERVDMSGDWWLRHIHEDDRARVASGFQAALAGPETTWSDRYRFERADGEWLNILDRGYIVRDGAGRAIRAIGSMTDMTAVERANEERAALEKVLEQTTRVAGLGRVAATIAHEFNNVLMAIQPYAEILRRRSAEMPAVEKPATQILQAVRRGKRVTEEILRFTRPAEPVMTTVDLGDWLRRFADQIAELALTKIDVKLQPFAGTLRVTADPAQLDQVVINLVVNARDAMPEGGTLTIATLPCTEDTVAFVGPDMADQFACILVSDTGEGMSPEVRSKIFEPLFTTKTRGGTGLGLAVAQQIITRHKGYIAVESEPGHGSVFSILLPRIS